MRYPHIMAAVFSECWAMEESKFHAMMDFLEVQFAGGKFTRDEIEARIGKGQAKSVARQQGAIAILPLQGTIVNRASMMNDASGGTSAEQFGQVFSAAIADPQVKAIVLDVNSPGGMVSGTDELSSLIHSARGIKPIVSHVNSTAASAAYWIASAADEMVVTPTGSVGSIGVLGAHDDMSAQMASDGISRTVISAGKYKAEASPYGPLSDSAKAHMQAQVDQAYGMFIKAVARNRNVSQTAVQDGFGQGRMVQAGAAVAQGMADSVGTMSDVLARFSAVSTAQQSRHAFALEREKRALQI